MTPKLFEVEATTDSVRLWVGTRQPFEPKGFLLAARNELRTAIRGLRSRPLHLLAAKYHSLETRFVDVENVLFYNVGAAPFALLTQHGLRFERLISAPTASPTGLLYAHLQEYKVESPHDVVTEGPLKCSFYCHLPPLSSASKPHEIWWSAAQATACPVESVSGQYALRIVLGCPHNQRNVALFLKPLLDGLISAFHSESQLDREAAARLARRTGWPKSEITQRLQALLIPILGPRRLLNSYREFVKWNPADDLCSSCTIVTRDSLRWGCIVDVYEVT